MQALGFQVFWILKSWMHSKLYRTKLRMVCEQILKLCGSARKKLYDQHQVNQYLKELASKIAPLKGVRKSEEIKKNMIEKKKAEDLPEVV